MTLEIEAFDATSLEPGDLQETLKISLFATAIQFIHFAIIMFVMFTIAQDANKQIMYSLEYLYVYFLFK